VRRRDLPTEFHASAPLRIDLAGGGTDVQAALGRAGAALDELAAAVRRQEQEIARLRAENEKLEEIRRLARRVAR